MQIEAYTIANFNWTSFCDKELLFLVHFRKTYIPLVSLSREVLLLKSQNYQVLIAKCGPLIGQ